MALIKCPECGREISDMAESCPQCGFPMKDYRKTVEDKGKEQELEKQRIEEEDRIRNKVCPECGKVVGDAEVCPFCGVNILEKEEMDKQKAEQLRKEELKEEELNKQKAEQQNKEEQNKDEKTEKIIKTADKDVKKKRRIIVGIVIAVVAAVVILIAAFSVHRSRVNARARAAATESSYSSSYSDAIISYAIAQKDLDITVTSVKSNSVSTICSGTIKNTGSETYRYVQVKGSFKDSKGDVIDTDSTYAVGSEGLAPGESSTFEIHVNKNTSIKSCDVSVYSFKN